jgi:hypothetical protein
VLNPKSHDAKNESDYGAHLFIRIPRGEGEGRN